MRDGEVARVVDDLEPQQEPGRGSSALRVVSESGEYPIPNAWIFARDPFEIITRTDQEGVATIRRYDNNDAPPIVYADGFAMQAVEPGASSVALRDRPVMRVILQGVSLEAASAHDFLVAVESDYDSLLHALGRHLKKNINPVQNWNGFGALEFDLPFFGSCRIQVYADNLATGIAATAGRDVPDIQRFSTHEIGFVPPLQSVAVAVDIIARVEYEDANVRIKISGPTVPGSGVLIVGRRKILVVVEGLTNEEIRHSCQLAPGTYSWQSTVVGVGTFDAGEFAVGIEPGPIRIKQSLDLVTGTIGVHGVDRTVDLRAMRGLITVSGKVLDPSDARNGYAEWRYRLPRGSELYAVAHVRNPGATSLPVKIPTDASGGHVDIMEWTSIELVKFAVDGGRVSPTDLHCVEVRDDKSGMVRVSDFSASPEVGPMALTPGAYSVRVRSAGDAGEWLRFTVPGSSLIRISH